MQAELDALREGASRRRSARWRRSSAAPRFRPSSICSAICCTKVETLIIGGGMANTFLAAQGKPVGKSLCENDLIANARDILAKAKSLEPRDRAAGRRRGGAKVRRACALARGRGRRRRRGRHDPRHRPAQHRAGRSRCWPDPRRWSGTARSAPSRCEPFDNGTDRSGRGGGGTHRRPASLSVLPAAATPWRRSTSPGVTGRLTYVSTAGGAFLEWLEGKTLPGVEGADGAARLPRPQRAIE